MIDLRSRRILDFVLIDEKSYDSLRIRRLMNRVCDRVGLPRRGFYFECGIWKSSKLVTGAKHSDLPGIAAIQTGFGTLGVEFRHAKTPRAKPIERVLGLLQDRLEAIPGYAGRNEVVDRFERIHRAKLDVDARRKHPSEAGFMSAEQWFGVLERICEEFNEAPLHGGSTNGLSPDDAWEKLQDSDNPPAKLPPEARHLLATHRTAVTVGRNGVRITIGKRSFVYRSAETGDRRGQRVIAWFEPEAPEFCTITDADGRNPVVVPLAPSVPAMDATREEMAAGMASAAAHEGAIRERYSQIRTKFLPAVRTNIVCPSVAEFGRSVETQRDQLKLIANEQARRASGLRSRLAETNPGPGSAALAADAASDPERAEALGRLAAFASS
jgi:hypothetical protein